MMRIKLPIVRSTLRYYSNNMNNNNPIIPYTRKYLFSYLPHTCLPLTAVLRNRLYLVISVKELMEEHRKEIKKISDDSRKDFIELRKDNSIIRKDVGIIRKGDER